MEKKWELYVYGDVNIDIVIPEVTALPAPGREVEVSDMKTFVGGGAALFALGAGKLGLKTAFQGELGNDFYGEFIRTQFLKSGVDDSLLIKRQGVGNGISLSFTNKKDRSFLTYRGTNENLSLEKINLENIKKAKHIHVTGYCGQKNHKDYLTFLQEIKKYTDTTISLDVGWDAEEIWGKEIYDLFPYLDVLFMNETEAIHYGYMHRLRKGELLSLPIDEKSVEKIALEFSERGPITVIKRGKKGALAVYKDLVYKAPAYRAEAVDTTGAGDSFNAGFIYGFIKAYSIQNCLKFANACGAFSVTALGGNTAFPDEKRLLAFVENEK